MKAITQPGSWLRSSNLPRLAFAGVLAPPLAGVLLSLILGFTIMRSVIFLAPHPEIDSEFVQADAVRILINTVVVGVGGLMMGGVLGWPLMMLLGLPVHAVLLHTTTARAWHYVAAGLAAGIGAGFLRYARERDATTDDLVTLLSIGGAAGALAALIFWLVRRPDRDTAERTP